MFSWTLGNLIYNKWVKSHADTLKHDETKNTHTDLLSVCFCIKSTVAFHGDSCFAGNDEVVGKKLLLAHVCVSNEYIQNIEPLSVLSPHAKVHN